MAAATLSHCRHLSPCAAPRLGRRAQRRARLTTQAVESRAGERVRFPRDYSELVRQVQNSLQLAHADGVLLQEVQFPVAGLAACAGDAEGNAETNITIKLLRQLLDAYKRDGTQERTRVFFPDTTELAVARGGAAATPDGVPAPANTFSPGAFGDYQGPCTHLFEPSFLTVSGLSRMLDQHPRIERRTKDSDARFVIAYPSHNIDELVEVAELHERVAKPTGRPIVVVMGEMERIRSGYYPAFWSRTEMALLREFTPKFEQVYYIHNFKGATPAVLFRAYPGPFQVLINTGEGGFVTVWQGDKFPGHKEVALNILPAALAEWRAGSARKR